ncbi:MAG TPA: ABC transporter substrate-binding protein, partial [Solirubrobacteraceae bacterium]
MTRRLIRTTAAISAVVLAVGATACGSDDQKSAGGGAAKQTVKVGGLFDLSGPTADVSTPYSEGIKGFVTSWNDKGDGPTIELSSVDYKYDVA